MQLIRSIVFSTVCLLTLSATAGAQTAPSGSPNDNDWKFTLYPVLVWAPTNISIDVNVPPVSGGGGDNGAAGEVVDGRFDGAFFGGFAASNGVWRLEGYGLWAAIGGDRPDTPFLQVDVDILYGDAKLGRRIAPDLFLSGGVRRLAFDYTVKVADLPQLARKPGIWDPIIGIGWHRVGPRLEWHASVDGGGFGVGSDVDVAASFRVDWKPFRVFGFTAGYNLLYLEVGDTVANRDVTLKTTFHGPAVGLGFYF